MPTTWTASFIAPDSDLGSAPLLRRAFSLDVDHGAVVSATLDVSALGVVEATLDGQPVSPDVLAPGWTSYEWRLRVVQYDVGHLLAAVEPGSSTVLGLTIGNGWATGRLTWSGGRSFYASERAGFAELAITFADGHVQRITTDTDWTAHPTDITADDLYDGEDIDARRRTGPVDSTGTTGAVGVHVVPVDTGKLVVDQAPPVRRLRSIAPAGVDVSPAGKTIVDFGENVVGWVRVRVSGPAGAVVTVRHAEVLDGDELGTRPLRSALATDRLTLSGGDDEFEPTFTFHGFRYVEVDGWPGSSDELLGALTAVVVGTDLRRTGTFRSSHALLNDFHDNVVRGMQGNFLSVPTDCPQRDERLGWTGDIAAFAPTAAFLFDTSAFLGDWLRDLAAETTYGRGVVPLVVPDVLKYLPELSGLPPRESVAVWSDAAVWVPWALWTAHGDEDALREQFPTMATHLRHVSTLVSPNGLWDTGFQYGDWLDPDAPPHDAAASKADPSVVATACAFRTATIVAEAAALLGYEADATEAAGLAARLQAAFREHYVADGRIRSDCTTVYALAIVFGLLDDADERAAGDRLAELVAASGHRISTGFAGTPFITDALTQTGHLDDAYLLLLQTECPSWLYPVTMGATTIWERWDSMLPDGSINPGDMTSFNHYALGAVADWMHRVVGGLAPLTPGYEEVLVAPQPGGGITWAETTLKTRRGRIEVRWDGSADVVRATVVLPPGTTATIRIPGLDEHTLGAGRHELVGAAHSVPTPA